MTQTHGHPQDHSHGHPHDHTHGHGHAPHSHLLEGAGDVPASSAGGGAEQVIEEGSWAPTGPATVLLDIGGDVGSLVVVTGPSLAGEEIEVESGSAVRIHTAVRERHMGAGVFHAAVFAGIPAGEWGLSVRGGSTRETVHITGGGVLELDWR